MIWWIDKWLIDALMNVIKQSDEVKYKRYKAVPFKGFEGCLRNSSKESNSTASASSKISWRLNCRMSSICVDSICRVWWVINSGMLIKKKKGRWLNKFDNSYYQCSYQCFHRCWWSMYSREVFDFEAHCCMAMNNTHEKISIHLSVFDK